MLGTFLPPATKLGQGYVFTSVCDSVRGGLPHCMLGYTHPRTRGRHPPGQVHPPPQCMLGYGQQAGGTHPAGMHSCLTVF